MLNPEPISKIKSKATKTKASKSKKQTAPNDYDLEREFEENKCYTNLYTDECNKFLLKKEILERNELEKNPEADDYLYPTLNDPNFNIKIAEKKEFNDTKYDGTIYNVKEQAEILSKADFELAPHQAFVRNFMSFQTPYNSLLLFHALGSGKTLSAIGVCEEMRVYLKQMGIVKRIIIVASPNVQDNFRLQLFDERRLKLVDGLWTMRDATGNRLLKEINPMNMKGLKREKVISQIKGIINSSYLFLGYIEFANYIDKTQQVKGEYKSEKEKKARMLRNLQNEFDNRLIVVDEVHNIRIADDNDNKKVADKLLELVKSANNLRLLLLSATPMYNSYQEVIWLLNLMNINDRRGTIEIKDVFDKNGDFKKNSKGEEVGKELLMQKATGYISFVRGENPYTFPFRVYPEVFSPDHSFLNRSIKYPKYQMNGKLIKDEDKLKILKLYLTNIGEYQSKGYQFIIDSLRKRKITTTTKKGVVREMPSFENMESFGYTLLQIPIEALNIVYPIEGLEESMDHVLAIEDYSESDEPSMSPDSLEKEERKPAKTPAKKPATKTRQTKLLSVEDEEKPDLKTFEKPFLGLESEMPVEPQRPLTTVPSAAGEEGQVVELTKKPSSEPSVSSVEFEPVVKEKGGASPTPKSSSSSDYARINAHDLTGRRGLERMMDFVDKKSPPEKGSFEYKPQTLRNYGRIFSPDEIGKYSSKIKNICDNIVSPDGAVNKGIIMIYAQYIDGGVLPVALALEELGFTRYGDGAKSLFKTPPVEPVDARTMKPRTSKKADFIPARYSLITGDPRISPNNAFEVKASTSEDNKDGNKIKVIIISQAGAEGVDFKFLRQVHILQPWYNMSRIEQIIGRAVRNFSHKDLPFEDRNVEIFMYGTILEKNKEEAADLYIYRVAEYKAVQIGKVTRLLKETAVDCIINHDQTNFTQDIMQAYEQGTVEQILSNGETIEEFRVGDAPYSAACDYMENCEYKCYPTKEIGEDSLNENSYNETFIMMNSEKIIQKIRALMKERFFYKKNDLILRINTPKPYPLVQIYAALTQVIENSNEYINDKYGRNGHLINIGEYYFFQPIELNSHNVSIFDRSVPIDFKHSSVNFEIKPEAEITKQVIDKRHLQEMVEESRVQVQKENVLFKELKDNFETAIHFARTGEKIARGDENWYKHCGITMRKLIKDGIPENDVLMFLVEHIVDLLLYREKVELLNYLYSLEVIQENSLEKMMKDYLDSQIVTTRRLVGIILFAVDKRKIMIYNKASKKWVDGEPEDDIEIASAAADKFRIPQGVQFNAIVGFIDNEKSNKYLVFKTKQTDAKRNTGARCDEAVKGKKLQILNMIVGEEKYTKENTKGMVQAELCALQEFLLRYYNKITKDNKMWFFNFELAKLYNF
jgi:superfamily II DNA or RNA helicase